MLVTSTSEKVVEVLVTVFPLVKENKLVLTSVEL